MSIVVSILQMIMLLLIINHLIACLWWGCADISQDPRVFGDSWAEEYGFVDKTLRERYAVSFHWSITQFTPSSMMINPMNVSERGFAIFVVIFALVGFSYVVGSITGSLTQLRSMQESASKQFWALRRYLKMNKVDAVLRNRVQRYAEHSYANQQSRSNVSNIPMFQYLSEQLLSELQCEMIVPNLRIHPLLGQMERISPVSMQRLSNTAIANRHLARKDQMFIPGEIGTNMYVLVSGRLSYQRVDSHGEMHQEWVDQLEDWISEPVLWTHGWRHLGGCVAVNECDLLCVVPKKFSDVMNKNPTAYHLACTYAQNFAKWMNTMDMDEQSDIIQGDKESERHFKFMELEEEVRIEKTESKPMFMRSLTRMRSLDPGDARKIAAQANKLDTQLSTVQERDEEAANKKLLA